MIAASPKEIHHNSKSGSNTVSILYFPISQKFKSCPISTPVQERGKSSAHRRILSFYYTMPCSVLQYHIPRPAFWDRKSWNRPVPWIMQAKSYGSVPCLLGYTQLLQRIGMVVPGTQPVDAVVQHPGDFRHTGHGLPPDWFHPGLPKHFPRLAYE